MKRGWLLQDARGREWVLSLADGADRPEAKRQVSVDRQGAVLLLDGERYRFLGNGYIEREVNHG